MAAGVFVTLSTRSSMICVVHRSAVVVATVEATQRF